MTYRGDEKVWCTAGHLAACARVEELNRRHDDADARELIRRTVYQLFPGRTALVSSFGTESAVLLAMVADVDPATPVLFLETGKLFAETLTYRDRLVRQLGLRDVRNLQPKPEDIQADDPDGTLNRSQPDLCCHIRKTLPLVRGLRGFDAWMTGRKQYHGGARSSLTLFEHQDGRIKLNPLRDWTGEDLERERVRLGLPEHPLVAHGYRSVGCIPCTTPAALDEDPRAGRWRESDKTECGIHFDADGRVVRST